MNTQEINQWLRDWQQHLPPSVVHKLVAVARAYQNPTVDNLLAAIDDDRTRAERKVLSAAKALARRICSNR